MKGSTLVFLEKSGVQRQEIQYYLLFLALPQCVSQNGIIQQNYFPSDPGETRSVKKTDIKKVKKIVDYIYS